MKNYITELEIVFQKHSNSIKASQMKRYLKNQFEFFGISAPLRREITRNFLRKENLPPVGSIQDITSELWGKPEREFQHFAVELSTKYLKYFEPSFIYHFEYLITTKSWWDTVDFIAPNLVGKHFASHPELTIPISNNWANSDNMWLQRASIIFQLKYKTKTNQPLLFKYITMLSNSKEFFIRKAIGWALREYSKTDPQTVIEFVNSHDLSGLSRREALKRIK